MVFCFFVIENKGVVETMRNLRIIWKFMKGNRLLYLGAIISMGFAIVFTLTGPLVIKLTIDSIIGNKQFEAPTLIINLIQKIGGRNILVNRLWICSLLLVCLTILRGIFLYLKGKWSAQASESIAKGIREKLYDHLQHLSYDYHVKAETGDLVQRCTSDVETIRRFLAVQLTEIGRGIFMIVFVSIVMIKLNVKMALISLSIVPIIFGFAVIFFMKIKKAFKLSDEAEGKLSTVLQEDLTGVRVVRAFARQSFEMEKFDKTNTEYRDLTYRLIKLLAGYWAFSDLMCMLQTGAILIIGSYWASKQILTIGALSVFLTYEGMLLWPVRQMGRILTDLGKTIVSIERINEILDESIEGKEKNETRPNIKGEIEFKNVCFGYENNKYVLENVSFRIKQGQTIAILGSTGSGKSSLVQLLARLYDYQKGSIKIDGVELRDIEKKWIRKNVGIVLQEPFLYSRSIRENIAISKRGAKEHEIYQAASTASVHEVILDFDKGYDTLVGERGVTLSGGQKQRVAIARTLINRYPILVFDDSLSAVDTETDAEIREALEQNNYGATTIIISHRIVTLSQADKIFVMDNGRIIQSGTHEELINKPGLYKRVWEIQNCGNIRKEKIIV